MFFFAHQFVWTLKTIVRGNARESAVSLILKPAMVKPTIMILWMKSSNSYIEKKYYLKLYQEL